MWDTVNALWQRLARQGGMGMDGTAGDEPRTDTPPNQGPTRDHSTRDDLTQDGAGGEVARTNTATRRGPLAGLGGFGARSDRPAEQMGQWAARGMNERQGKQFAVEIQRIPAIALFAQVLPAWSARHRCGVQLSISSRPEWHGGAGVELSFDRQDLPVAQGNDLLTRLEAANTLLALTHTIEHMKAVGVDAAHIDPLVAEADRLAEQAHRA